MRYALLKIALIALSACESNRAIAMGARPPQRPADAKLYVIDAGMQGILRSLEGDEECPGEVVLDDVCFIPFSDTDRYVCQTSEDVGVTNEYIQLLLNRCEKWR